MDRMRVTEDQCTKMYFNKETERMEGVKENNPTPLLNVEMIQDNGDVFTYSALPDTGSTKAIIALDLARKHGIRWKPMDYEHILTDAQGKRMDVTGMAVLRVRAESADGCLNKQGHFHMIPCIVSSALVDDMFLSWGDLIKIGTIPPHFPEVWSSKEKWLESRATMTPDERCRNTSNSSMDSRIEEIFDKYMDVFAEDLASGKTMKVPMVIKLDENIAKNIK